MCLYVHVGMCVYVYMYVCYVRVYPYLRMCVYNLCTSIFRYLHYCALRTTVFHCSSNSDNKELIYSILF